MTSPLTAVVAADDEHQDQAAEPRERTIEGQILEYGVRSHPGGPFDGVTFAPGSLEAEQDLTRVKLLRDHDRAQPLGVMSTLADSEIRADAIFRMGRHQAADEALSLAADGVLDGLSVGVEPIEWSEDDDGKGVTVTRAALREVSLVALPAYTNARATRVTAERTSAMPPEPTTPPPPAAPVEAVEETVRRIMAELRAPEQAAPLAAPEVTASIETADAHRPARVIDRDGYGRRLPGIVAGRERVDAADYLAASLELMVNGNRIPFERVTRVIRAATANETTDMVPGLLPQVIVGPIQDRLSTLRPVWNSLAVRTMPSTSNKFERLRITQHTKVDQQAKELDELASQQLKVSAEDVAKSTYGGWVNISRQVVDWTTPGALSLIIEDLTSNLMRQAETRACTDLVTTAGTPVEVDLDDPAALNAAIYTAAATVYQPHNNPPDRVWMSPDIWALLGSHVDESKRPLFPVLSPSNALGSVRPSDPAGGDFVGLRIVVGGQLPAGTLIVGVSEAVEVYEDLRGMLEAVQPSALSTQIATYGYLATYPAQPAELAPLKQKAKPGGSK
ncbi:HK97 family phage prohead protease [Streptomyces sp. NPDC050485]|uniref:HK97 family phage prohead protease n=1 Tax=Streptomyces sp. NPDC050485 TaxID=3365617 RepID=UPI0037B804B0